MLCITFLYYWYRDCCKIKYKLLLMAFSELSEKKRIKSQSYIYLNVISCYWQLVWLQVRKPFDRDAKCASFKNTKSK